MQVYKCLSCNMVRKIKDDIQKASIDCPRCDGTMYRIAPKMKLGEILLCFNWITEEELDTALDIQKQLKQSYPIGKVLRLTGKLESSVIENALEFQRKEFVENVV